MREDVRFVEVKVVDDVRVVQGLEFKERIKVGPPRAGGKNGVPRGTAPYRCDDLFLHRPSVPAETTSSSFITVEGEEEQDVKGHGTKWTGLPSRRAASVALGARRNESGCW